VVFGIRLTIAQGLAPYGWSIKTALVEVTKEGGLYEGTDLPQRTLCP
jgi:hypothetical protein